MKKIFRYLLALIAIGAVGGYIYWQRNKKGIVKNAVEDVVSKKSDSLYFIKYDSSNIDEVGGNVSFFGVSLQSDDTQKRALAYQDSLPNSLYIIRVNAIKASGVDIPGLLQNERVSARKIILDKPSIQVINTGADQPKAFTYDDTLALYKKILGKFSSIKADTIQVNEGAVLITNSKGKPLTSLENININLRNFLVDETHDYQSIISYFIKDVKATVGNIQLPESKNKTRINISKLDYDAQQRSLKVGSLQQYQTNNTAPLVDLSNIVISDLNTGAFINYQQLYAGNVTCAGGLITITKRSGGGAASKNKALQVSSDLMENARIGSVNLGKTKLVILNADEPSAAPFVLNDVRFIVSKAVQVTDGKTIGNLVSNAEWQFFSSGFSLFTRNKEYQITGDELQADNVKGTASIKTLRVIPQLTEAEFAKRSIHQRDRFDLKYSNVVLSDLNFKKLITENIFEAGLVSLQPYMKIFNDRTVPIDPNSKVGKYPQQALMKMDFPVYIKEVKMNNGYIEYKEKAAVSTLEGKTYFSNLSATISNVTNIPARVQQNKIMKVDARAKFLGTAPLSTQWLLPLDSGNATFTATGKMGFMKGAALNPLVEPLAMVSIKGGDIKSVSFEMKGNDYKAEGNVLILYNGLKLQALKQNEDKELKKKGLISLVANILVRNNNPQNGVTRKNDFTNERELNKSFFNLLWKSVFAGVKKTALGKSN